MATDLSDMVIEEISLVDDGANEGARVEIVKALHGARNQAADDEAAFMQSRNTEYHMDLESLSKALEDAEAKLTTLEKRASDAEAANVASVEVIKAKDAEIEALKKAAAPAPTEEDVLKSLPESVRKRIEKAEADAKAATDEVAKARDAAETAESIEKARKIGVGDAKVVGPLLRRVAKGQTTAEDAAALEGVLKAAAAAANPHLFRSLGSDAAVDGDPEELLKAKATEIQKAKGVTFEAAYAAAMEQNPSLYSAYIQKRRA
ncbi:hypothetical protein UFOVP119_73 [uncultured Caudovirales phage]|uniref:Uncharacterized protein n=1 Tax=uncultured Caudovirales phage TaxID=2100421 RepID=A0A6J5LFN5_9CAUD|nr:hypothetical protein UFOVP119_73 [uncultured Caudovirales phage]